MPASTHTPVGAAGSILLVEDYGALATAIGAAIKKFAPSHLTRVVDTFAAAEASALEHRPELLVIDFDPPQKGAIEFFNRMKSALPDTRVVVLTAGIPPDVVAARRKPAAFQFVEKPFELAAFGAAVEASVRPSQPGTEGTLRHLNLADVLPLLCGAGVTIVIDVHAASGRAGEIHLAHGQIVHAAAAGWRGADALQEMLRWDSPHLVEAERPGEGAGSAYPAWATLLATVFANSSAATITRRQPVRAKAAQPPTKKLVVIDDTELLLIFVEEVLASANADIEIITADSGHAGLKQVRAVKPDAILLDFSLPDITGAEVCRQLREDDETADIPIIMMSGHVPEMTATAERYDNVVATIAKPFLSAAMVERVLETLASPRRQLSRQNKPEVAASESEAPEPPVAPAKKSELAAEPNRPVETNGKHHVALDAGQAVEDTPPTSAAEAQPPATSLLVAAPATKPYADVAASDGVRSPRVIAPPATAFHVLPRESSPVDFPNDTSLVATPERWLDAEPTELAVVAPQAMPRVRISAATHNAVVLGLSLEVVAMRFSSALQMAAIRARPWSWTVSLHVHPHAMPGVALPEAGFELGKVDLNARGHIDAVRLVPTTGALTRPPRGHVFPVGDITILPGADDRAMELMPGAAAPMTMQLFASFELVDVELSSTFGIGALVLKSRGGDIRVTLQPSNATAGAIFKSAQVLLDRSARIAEVLLDAVA